LVLEIGAGGNPYPRANVLLDAYEATPERIERALVSDRPVVLGFAERLPFKDGVFDFAIASHVLEHSAQPEAFLTEMARVAKAGYVETPDAFFERINPFTYHRLEVTDRDGWIVIHKKPSWLPDGDIVDLYERKVKDPSFIRFLSRHPAPFYMRYYWRERIQFRVDNPEIDASWALPPEAHAPRRRTIRTLMKSLYLPAVRRVFSQNARNRDLDLIGLLQCPTCRSGGLESAGGRLSCVACGCTYPIRNRKPILFPVEH
jgi:SAM-dependent methyltransferase